MDQDDREVLAVKGDVKKPSGEVIGAKAKHRQKNKLFSCKKCGEQHPPRKCPPTDRFVTNVNKGIITQKCVCRNQRTTQRK